MVEGAVPGSTIAPEPESCGLTDTAGASRGVAEGEGAATAGLPSVPSVEPTAEPEDFVLRSEESGVGGWEPGGAVAESEVVADLGKPVVGSVAVDVDSGAAVVESEVVEAESGVPVVEWEVDVEPGESDVESVELESVELFAGVSCERVVAESEWRRGAVPDQGVPVDSALPVSVSV